MLDGLKRALPVLLLAAFLVAAMRMGPKDAGQTEITAGGESVLDSLFFVKDAKGKPVEENEAAEYPLSADAFFLDTFCTLTVYEGGGREALLHAGALLRHYDDLFHPEKESSDIYRINHRRENRVEIDPETARMLSEIREIEALSEGDFDITVGNLTALWDFQDEKKVPPKEAIIEAREKVHPQGWEVSGNTFIALNDDIKIDVGAFAKGYIADRLKETMKAEGVSSAIINLGGNVQCIGVQPGGEDFYIGLKKPERGSSELIKRLSVNDSSVVTAGIYERYFEENGVHYHHILDPESGYPVQNELAAVTVVGKKSVICDALSTTLFIKGTEAGTAFLREYNELHAVDGKRDASNDNKKSAADSADTEGATDNANTEPVPDSNEMNRYRAYFILKDGSVIETDGEEIL